MREMAPLLRLFSHVHLFVTSWTVARQAPLSMDSPGKNTRVGSHALSPGDLPDPGMEPVSLSLQNWQAGSLPLAPPWKPQRGMGV